VALGPLIMCVVDLHACCRVLHTVRSLRYHYRLQIGDNDNVTSEPDNPGPPSADHDIIDRISYVVCMLPQPG
jgi:hypothetical protein